MVICEEYRLRGKANMQQLVKQWHAIIIIDWNQGTFQYFVTIMALMISQISSSVADIKRFPTGRLTLSSAIFLYSIVC